MEYWMRSDPRLTYRDLKARMTAAKEDLPSDNALNMRREREARLPLGLSCWTTRRGEITKTEVERVERWSHDQITLNTTLDIEYTRRPGTRPVAIFLLSKSLVEAPPCKYDICTFLDESQQPHTPGPRIRAAIELLFQLQDAVITCGVSGWKDLPSEYLPRSWTRRSNHLTLTSLQGQQGVQSVFPGSNKKRVHQTTATTDVYRDNGDRSVAGVAKMKKENDQLSGLRGKKEAGEKQRLGDSPIFTPADKGMAEVPASSPISTEVASQFHQDESSKDVIMAHGPKLYDIPRFKGGSATDLPQTAPSSPSQNESGRDTHFRLNFPDSPPEPPLQHQDPFGLSRSPSALSNSQDSSNGYSSYQIESFPTFGRQLTYDNSAEVDMDIGPDGRRNKGCGDFHRFNGAGISSVKNNPGHPVNTNTIGILQRNNPFVYARQPLMAAQRSFETFVMDCD